MLTHSFIKKVLEEFNSSTRQFLCRGSPLFKHHWDKDKTYRDELRRHAQAFIDTTPVGIIADHVKIHVACEEYPEQLFLFCADGTSNQDDRDIRLAFLNWLVQQDFLP